MNEDPRQEIHLVINVVLTVQGILQPETGDTITVLLEFIDHATTRIYAAQKSYNLMKFVLF